MQKPSNHIESCANISAEMANLVEEVDSADAASGPGGAGTHPSDVGPEYLLAAEEAGSHQPPHPLLDEVLVEHSEDICSFIAHKAVRGLAAGLCSSPVLSWEISTGSGTGPGSVHATGADVNQQFHPSSSQRHRHSSQSRAPGPPSQPSQAQQEKDSECQIVANSDESPTQREGEWDINTFGSDNIRNGKRRKLAKLGVPIEPTLASEVRLLVLISLIYVHAEPCSRVWHRLDCDV